MQSSDADIEPELAALEPYAIDANNNPVLPEWNDHFYSLEARERLAEFPGRVPQRRKKAKRSNESNSSNQDAVITSQKQQNREQRPQQSPVINEKLNADSQDSTDEEPEEPQRSSNDNKVRNRVSDFNVQGVVCFMVQIIRLVEITTSQAR